MLHFHWPEAEVSDRSLWKSLGRSLALTLLLAWAKLLGKKVVWTVHNLQPHEDRHPRIGRAFRRAFLATLDGYFILSDASRGLAEKTHPRLERIPSFVTRHGHYRGEYPDSVTAEAARLALGLKPGARVFLHFGQIRPYKNVPALIRSFRDIRSAGSVLVVAGSCSDPHLRQEVESAIGGDARVKAMLRFVPIEEVQVYMRAADLLVLPFGEILNSGSALLGLSFDRPVLAPHMGSLPELAQELGAPWVATYTGTLDAQLLEASMDRARRITPADVRALRNGLARFSWPEIARQTAEAYRELTR